VPAPRLQPRSITIPYSSGWYAHFDNCLLPICVLTRRSCLPFASATSRLGVVKFTRLTAPVFSIEAAHVYEGTLNLRHSEGNTYDLVRWRPEGQQDSAPSLRAQKGLVPDHRSHQRWCPEREKFHRRTRDWRQRKRFRLPHNDTGDGGTHRIRQQYQLQPLSESPVKPCWKMASHLFRNQILKLRTVLLIPPRQMLRSSPHSHRASSPLSPWTLSPHPHDPSQRLSPQKISWRRPAHTSSRLTRA